jgi:acyl carrier protein
MDDDTFTRVKRIIVDQLGIAPELVAPHASFIDDLDADSLDKVELIMTFEEAFEIEISDTAAEAIVTVQDAVDCIEQKKKAATA